MAKGVGNKTAEITIVIKKQEEVVKFLKHLKEQVDIREKQRDEAVAKLKALKDAGKEASAEYRVLQEDVARLESEMVSFKTSINETVKQSKNLNVVLEEISAAFAKNGTLTENQAKRWMSQLKGIKGSITSGDIEAINRFAEAWAKLESEAEKVTNAVKKATEAAKLSAQESFVNDVVDNAAEKSLSDIEDAIAVLKKMQKSHFKGDDDWLNLNGKIKHLEAWKNKFSEVAREQENALKKLHLKEILSDIGNASEAHINETIKLASELINTVKVGGEEWKEYFQIIREGRESLEFLKVTEEGRQAGVKIREEGGDASMAHMLWARDASKYARNALPMSATGAVESMHRQYMEADDAIRQYDTMLLKIEADYKGLEEVMSHLGKATGPQLKLAEQELTDALEKQSLKEKERIALSEKLGQIQAENTRRQKLATEASRAQQQVDADKAMGYNGYKKVDIGTANYEILKRAEKELTDLINSGELTKRKSINASKKLAEIQAELANRQQYVANATKEANQQIKDAAIKYEGYDAVLKNRHATTDQLKRAEQELTEIIGNGNITNRERVKLSEKLAKVQAVQAEREKAVSDALRNARLDAQKESAEKIISKPEKASVEALREAVKVTEQLRDRHAASSKQWLDYQQKIEAANAVLNAYAESHKKAVKEADEADKRQDALSMNTDNASAEQLRTNIKLLEQWRDSLTDVGKNELTGYVGANNQLWNDIENKIRSAKTALSEYESQLKESEAADALANSRNKARNILGDPNNFDDGSLGTSSIEEIREAIEVFKKWRDECSAGEEEWNNMTEAIVRAEQKLKDASVGLGNIDELFDFEYDDDLGKYVETLNKGKVSSERLKVAEEQLTKALKSGKLTQDEMAKNGRRLQLVHTALEKSALEAKAAAVGFKDMKTLMSQLDKAPIEQLKVAEEMLKNEINGATRGTKEYNEACKRLESVQGQLKEVNKDWAEHKSAISKAIDRLKTYVGVYMGFQEFLSIMKNATSSALKLSDAMSDIQKRTQLSTDQVREIGNALDDIGSSYDNVFERITNAFSSEGKTAAKIEINEDESVLAKMFPAFFHRDGKFDSRVSQQELYNLASTAGLLGLKAKDDIIGFTSAANQLKVALVELGDDGAEQLMKIATVTGDVARYGVEDALTKVGSSINALSANSAASAPAMIDFVSRVGAVGSRAKMTIADITGLGAALDALGQPMELSATSINRFIMSLQGNTRGIAAVLGMDADGLEAMVRSGHTMEAMITVLEKMKNSSVDMTEVFGELGSEGVRIKQTISSLMVNTEFLREQVTLSNDEFEKGTSVLNEYNVKNSNAAAIMERAGNALKKTFVDTETERLMKGFAQIFYDVSIGLHAIKDLLPAIITFSLSWWKISSLQNAEYAKTGLHLGGIQKQLLAIRALGRSIKNIFKGFSWGGLLGAGVLTGVMYIVQSLVKWYGELRHEAMVGIKETAKWFNDLQERITKAKDESNQFFDTIREGLKSGETNTKSFKDALDAVNSRYAQYINFTVTQTTSLQQLALAQQAVNAAIEDNITAQSKAARISAIHDEFAPKKEAQVSKFEQVFVDHKLSANQRTSVRKLIFDFINSAVAKGYTGEKNDVVHDPQTDGVHVLRRKLQNALGTYFKGKNNLNEEMARELYIPVRDYINAIYKENERIESANTVVDSESETAHKNFIQKQLELVNSLQDDYKKKFKEWDKKDEEEAKKLLEIQNNFQNTFSVIYKDLDEKTRGQYSAIQHQMQQNEVKLRSVAGLVSSFGYENIDVSKMSADELKKYSDALLAEWRRYSANGDFAKFGERVRGTGFGSSELANRWIHDQKEAIKRRADELWVNPPAGWKWDEKESESEKKKAQDIMAGMLAMLEEYYTRRKTAIEEARANEELSEGEYNRQLEELEKEHLDSRIKLRSEWVDKESNGFAYMEQSLWKDKLGFSEKQLNTLRGYIKKIGSEFETMQAKIKSERAKDMLQEQKNLNKHRDALEKALLDGDEIAKMVDTFKKGLDDLDLVFGMSNDRAEWEAQRRILILQKMARQMEGVFRVEDMRALLKKNGLEDILQLDDDHIRVLMDKLNDFSEKYETAIKNMASKAEKLYKSQMRSGAWDKMALQYMDEKLRQARDKKVYAELDNADFISATSPVVETTVVLKTRVVDGENKVIETVDADATAAVRKAIVDMFNANPSKTWNVAAIRAAAEKRGGEVAKFFASIQDSEVKKISDELKKYAPTKKVTRTVSGAGNSAADKVMTRMMQEFGLTVEQAAGIAGNIGHESAFNANARNPKNGMYGLAQWDTRRRANFKKAIGRDIHGSSFDQQLDFLVHELKTTESAAIDAIKKTTTVSGAAASFERNFERANGSGMADRKKRANQYLKNFSGTVMETVSEVKSAALSVDKLGSLAKLLTVKSTQIEEIAAHEEQYEEVLEKTVEKFDPEKSARVQEQFVALFNANLGLEWDKDNLRSLSKQQSSELGDFLEKMADDEINEVVGRLNAYTRAHVEVVDKAQLDALEDMRKKLIDRATRSRSYYDDQDAYLKRLQERAAMIGKMESNGEVSNYATDRSSVDVSRMELEIAQDYVDMLKLRFAWEKNNLEIEKQRLIVQRDQLNADDPLRTVKQNEINEIGLKIDALTQEELAATSHAMDELRKKSESLAEAEEKMFANLRKNFKTYGDSLKEMMQSVASAGSEHANLTSLAEIAAKRRLGIAVDETKQEYLIYSRNGKAIRQMMTEEEKFRWDMENDSRNQRLDALVKWIDDWGKKMSEDITNAFANRVALEQQEEIERQEVERATSTADAKKQIESGVTQARQGQFQSQFASFKEEQDAELQYAEYIAQQKAALGTPNTPMPAGNTPETPTAPASAPVGADSVIAPTEHDNGYYASGLVGTYANFAAEEFNALGLPEYAEQALESVGIVEGAYRSMQESVTQGNTEATKQMTNEQKQMIASMCQAANIYGIAYNAVMNENMDATQKMGLVVIQAVGQTVMTMLSAVVSQMVGENAVNLATATSRVFSQLGIGGWAAIAAITGTIGAASALATKAITKSKKEVAALTGAASGKKVAAGMLTYAEGNYPVLGSDGEVYNAKRETNWKTKVYSSPHYGILGEKGPELIVDGVTTRKMMTLRPDLYKDILDLAHGRQMVRARAYAEGNYPAMPAGNVTDTQAMLVAAISQLNNVTGNLNAQLANGITIDALGERGAVKQMQSAEIWMQKHGLM